MSWSDEVRDPWGLLVAGVSGGMAWALLPVAAALPLGVAVGAAVLGAKVASGVLVQRRRTVRRGPTDDAWLRRAEDAVHALEDLDVRGPLVSGARRTVDEATETLEAVRRLTGQADRLTTALSRVDAAGLEGEAERLATSSARPAPPDVQAELARSAAAVADRLAVRDRLRAARATLLARVQSATLGLEGLHARLSELVVLGDAPAGATDPVDRVGELAGELEALRAGLLEAEALSRGALAGRPPRVAGQD